MRRRRTECRRETTHVRDLPPTISSRLSPRSALYSQAEVLARMMPTYLKIGRAADCIADNFALTLIALIEVLNRSRDAIAPHPLVRCGACLRSPGSCPKEFPTGFLMQSNGSNLVELISEISSLPTIDSQCLNLPTVRG